MRKPLPGTDTTIIVMEAETGEIGEIAIPVRAPVIFDGYYEKPDLDTETYSGEYYHTGDLATATRTASSTSRGAPTTSSSRQAT